MSRVPNPTPNEIVERLQGPDNEVEDVVALIGFVGVQRDGHVVLHPDVDYQRWLAIPADDVVDSEDVPDGGGRSVVWVKHSAMQQHVFNENVLETLDQQFEHGSMSTWPLIPDTLYVAAGMLDLLPRDPETGQGGYA